MQTILLTNSYNKADTFTFFSFENNIDTGIQAHASGFTLAHLFTVTVALSQHTSVPPSGANPGPN